MICDAETRSAAKARRKKSKKKTLAEKADKFLCYQLSVQSPDHEIEFFDQAYRDAFGKKAYSLREDFCGTFAVCCEWVKSNRKRTAVGIDLCPETLQWGRDNNLIQLSDKQQARVSLKEQDVRTPSEQPVDILAAQNFSFWIFKTRTEVRDYFKFAHANLADEGLMIMDMMGGSEAYVEDQVDKKKVKKGKKGFSYHWEQARFNPVNADCSFYIHFKFADGSKMKRAFEYHWRFWTIPEVRELLQEAGFSQTHVYWEQEDEDGEDTGVWARDEEAASHASWLAYIVAVK